MAVVEPNVFEEKIAYDPFTGSALSNAEADIYAQDDVDFTTPLPLTDLSGVPVLKLVSSDDGVFPPFKVDSVTEYPVVVAKSGPFTTVIRSLAGLKGDDGRGITDVSVAPDGALTVVLSDSTVLEAGTVPTVIVGGAETWDDISGKPDTFPPSGHTHLASQISNATPVGQAVMTATDQAAARAAIGAGTSNSTLTLGTTGSTAAPGNHTHAASSLPFTPASGITADNIQGAIVQAASMGGGGSLPGGALDATGSTEIGVGLQALYDAGVQTVTLKHAGSYTWNTALFLDRTDLKSRPFVIDGNGATITLGSGLPIASAFTGGSTKAAVFVNTKRAALSAGTVTVSEANQASSGGGLAYAFQLKNVRIETANSANVCTVYANRAAVHLENVNQKGGRAILSWYGYAEPMRVTGGYFESQGGANQVSDAFAVYGQDRGDGIIIDALKASGAVGAVRLSGCKGASIRSGVTGKIKLINSNAINIDALHQEAGIYDTYVPNVEVQSSSVKFKGGVLYRPTAAANTAVGPTGSVHINDSGTDRRSKVRFFGTEFVTFTNGVDENQGAHVYVEATQNSTGISATEIEAHGVEYSSVATGNANDGYWRGGTGLVIRSAQTALNDAVNTVAAKARIATGTFKVSRGLTGASGSIAPGWDVTSVEFPGLTARRPLQALASITLNVTDQPAGGTTASAYYYTAALRNSAGEYTALVTDANITPAASTTVRLLIQGSSVPGVLVLWRRIGNSDVRGGATAYVELPMSDQRTVIYDTGNNVAGVPWIVSSVPVPTAVATGATSTGLSLYGVDLAAQDKVYYTGVAWPNRPVSGFPVMWVSTPYDDAGTPPDLQPDLGDMWAGNPDDPEFNA